MRLPTIAIALGMTLTAACTDDASPLETSDDRTAELCKADFSVDVTSGPEAGFRKAGKLTLAPVGGALMGYLEAGAETIGVVGSASDQQLVLAFSLADGRKIVGVGPAPSDACSGMREGVAVGPSLDPSFDVTGAQTSVGHWVASNLLPNPVDYTIITYGNGLTSSDFGQTDNASAQVSCTGPSGVQYDITCRDGRDPIRDAFAHFFGVPYCSDVTRQCNNGGGQAGPVHSPNS